MLLFVSEKSARSSPEELCEITYGINKWGGSYEYSEDVKYENVPFCHERMVLLYAKLISRGELHREHTQSIGLVCET